MHATRTARLINRNASDQISGSTSHIDFIDLIETHALLKKIC